MTVNTSTKQTLIDGNNSGSDAPTPLDGSWHKNACASFYMYGLASSVGCSNNKLQVFSRFINVFGSQPSKRFFINLLSPANNTRLLDNYRVSEGGLTVKRQNHAES